MRARTPAHERTGRGGRQHRAPAGGGCARHRQARSAPEAAAADLMHHREAGNHRAVTPPPVGDRPRRRSRQSEDTVQTGARSSPVRGGDEVREIAQRANLDAGNVASVILGKEDVIESCVVALAAWNNPMGITE